jgi:hypothetical protein
MSGGNIFEASDWLFPGLLPSPEKGASGNSLLSLGEGPIANYQGDNYFNNQFKNWINTYLKGRAEGGPVEKDEPYMVGEKGPEVVVPKEDGTVIPNQGGGMEGIPPELVQLIQMIVMALMQGGGGMPGMGMQGPPPGGEMPIPRALGGAFEQGKQYLVGERGPETMVPQGASPQQPEQAAGPAQGMNPYGGLAGGIGAVGSGLGNTMQQGQQQAQPAGGAGYGFPGQAYTGWMMDYFNNPGQLSAIPYERAQEQANQTLNTGSQAIQGGLTGQGVDPNSPMGQALQQSLTLGVGAQRQEAARDYSLAEEAMQREDVQRQMSNYLAALQTVFGLQQARAGTALGGAYPNVTPINPYEGLARGASEFGYNWTQMNKSKQPTNPYDTGPEDPTWGPTSPNP